MDFDGNFAHFAVFHCNFMAVQQGMYSCDMTVICQLSDGFIWIFIKLLSSHGLHIVMLVKYSGDHIRSLAKMRKMHWFAIGFTLETRIFPIAKRILIAR